MVTHHHRFGGRTATAMVALAAAAGLGACASPAAAPADPGICRDLQAMNLPTADEMIDNAESGNGQASDAGSPMNTEQMAVIGRDAQALQGYAALVAGSFRSALQTESTEFSAAAHSPNGTVTNDQATSTDTAYKTIAAQCGGELG